MQHVTNLKAFRGINPRHLAALSLYGSEGEGDGSGTPPPGADGSGTPPANPPEGGNSTDAGTGDTTPKTYTQEYVDSLRAEAAANRVKAKQLEDEKAEREKEKLSEIDRIKLEKEEADARAKAAESALTLERQRNAIISEAAKLHFRDPEDALAHVDLTQLTMNEDGTPHKGSVAAMVKKVADAKSYLIAGPGSADGGATGSTPIPTSEKLAAMEKDIQARGGVRIG